MSTQLSPITQHVEQEGAASILFSSRYARFANFQVDLHRQEIFLDGQRLKMQAKVYQALALLLSRAGEIVSRDEVRKHLWPDTFLANLDANVNTTMNKLRQVLGDGPENPRYIETIPRRGYSFIASLQFSNTASLPDETPIAPAMQEVASVRGTKESFAVPRVEWAALLRIAGLLLAGMVIGALLTFVWFVAQEKSHRSLESAQQSRLSSPKSDIEA
jgi:DNA-binding winged helix-turn-helix (wHTH) protein